MPTVVDPLGRRVHLTSECWQHIIDGHPYMAPFCADTLRAVEAPTVLLRQPRPNQDWYYLEGTGPSRWIKVVVGFDGDSEGFIRTAFPRRSRP